MIDPTIPLLNAQQQGMAPLVNAVTTRAEVVAQASQTLVAELIKEESKRLDKVADDPSASIVSDREHGSQEFTSQDHEKREPEQDVETAPSYHNPMAGHLLNTKV